MARGERGDWPDQLFLLGDQVYVDEGSPRTRERDPRRGAAPTPPPGEEVTDFEEYTWLYHESWREPLIRWLFSTVSISMLWDDHDMSDDWNISALLAGGDARAPWWHRRAIGCIASYWIYQHLGNLSPQALDEDELYRAGARQRRTPTRSCFEWAERIDPTEAGDPLELLPRLRRDAGDLRRLAGGPGARGGRAARWSTRRSGTGSSTTPTATSTTC